MKISTSGSDDLGKFTVLIPGNCGVCHETQDVVVSYNVSSLKKGLGDIQLKSTIMGHKHGPIGVTCGCYARFQRQVAHIRHKRHGD